MNEQTGEPIAKRGKWMLGGRGRGKETGERKRLKESAGFPPCV